MVDRAYLIPDAESVAVCFQLLQEEGLCMGGSTGVNVAGAIRLAKEMGPGHTIVTLLCDYGTRYQSKLFDPAFLQSKNLPVPDWLVAERAAAAQDVRRSRRRPDADDRANSSTAVIPALVRRDPAHRSAPVRPRMAWIPATRPGMTTHDRAALPRRRLPARLHRARAGRQRARRHRARPHRVLCRRRRPARRQGRARDRGRRRLPHRHHRLRRRQDHHRARAGRGRAAPRTRPERARRARLGHALPAHAHAHRAAPAVRAGEVPGHRRPGQPRRQPARLRHRGRLRRRQGQADRRPQRADRRRPSRERALDHRRRARGQPAASCAPWR